MDPRRAGFKQPSVMGAQHSFSKVPHADIPRSRFNRSHTFKATFEPDYLVPVYVDEALPGDTFSMRPTLFARLATPLFPVMDNMYLDVFFFAVPLRLVWDKWQRFCGEQPNPGDSTDFLTPQLPAPTTTGWTTGSLGDYFGLPIGVEFDVNAFHSRAYNLIFNEWFRDENLVDAVVVDTDDGPDDPADYTLLKRGKRHDYFTSCLPWPQKGDAVSLPLGTTAPVIGDSIVGDANRILVQKSAGSQSQIGLQVANGAIPVNVSVSPDASGFLRWEEGESIGAVADLSAATAATINQLRESFQIQKLLERDARGGTRYTEVILSHFGVSSPDARLQRPEFLGGASVPVNVAPIAASAETGGRVVGDLSAFGLAVNNDGTWSKSFTEHCVIIGLANVRADLTYQQGVDRMFSRRTRYDFYWPVFAHLGEQAVLNKEIFVQDDPADDEVFGYQERWAEYRYKPSRIAGLFRSDAASSLDAWHLSQDFSALPVLNNTFITEEMPIDRVIAVPSEPAFLLDCWFDLKVARPMPTFSVPGLIDHF